MLKPIFFDNGLSYEDYAVEQYILMPEEFIAPMMEYFRTIDMNNYQSMLKDSTTKYIDVTEAMIYDYLKEHGIIHYTFNVEDTLIRLS